MQKFILLCIHNVAVFVVMCVRELGIIRDWFRLQYWKLRGKTEADFLLHRLGEVMPKQDEEDYILEALTIKRIHGLLNKGDDHRAFAYSKLIGGRYTQDPAELEWISMVMRLRTVRELVEMIAKYESYGSLNSFKAIVGEQVFNEIIDLPIHKAYEQLQPEAESTP